MSKPEPDFSFWRDLGDFARYAWPPFFGAGCGITARLLFSGRPGNLFDPMMTSFVLLVPLLVGATAVALTKTSKPISWGSYFWIGALANCLFVIGTFLILVEGLICVVLVIPLFGLVGGIGGMLMGAISRYTKRHRNALYAFAGLPLVFGAVEQNVPLPQQLHSIETSRTIAASPDAVWQVLIDARDIRPEELSAAWAYRIGVPLPQSAITHLDNGALVRHIEMGKQIHFDQVATDWAADRYIVWKNHFTSDSFPPDAFDEHVRIGGTFFDVVDAAYTLRPVAGGTELRTRIDYRVSTHFNWYTRPIAAALLWNFENNALLFYARRAESMAPHEAAG